MISRTHGIAHSELASLIQLVAWDSLFCRTGLVCLIPKLAGRPYLTPLRGRELYLANEVHCGAH